MPTQRARDEAEIRRQIDRLVDGIRTKDLDGLRELYTPDIVSFDVQPPLQRVGADGKSKNWADAFAIFQRVDYEVRELTLTVGDEVAFAHSINRLSGTMNDGTATAGMWVRCTYCFRKVDGTWLVAHDQVSVPLDFATGRGVTDLEPSMPTT